jgi:hypothetical protein
MSVSNSTQRLGSCVAIYILLWFWLSQGALAFSQSVLQGYASPEEAAAALATAARSHDQVGLSTILGAGNEQLLSSGDRYADEQQQRRFADAYDEKHELVSQGPERMVLHVGNNDWPFPMPIVQRGRWHNWFFDRKSGAEEIINRRIARNELAAIRVALNYVDAQKDYFERMRQQTGTGFYAERLISTPGRQDGLYWPTAAGTSESPFGPLMTQAKGEGYPGANVGGKLIPYQGYYFRVLRAQSSNAAGGAISYVRSRRMTGGFALIAWPAIYGSSGTMTFQVGHDGVVLRKDLGASTSRVASRVTRFDPDMTWARVEVTNK